MSYESINTLKEKEDDRIHVLFRAKTNAQEIFNIISEQTLNRIAPDVLLFLKDADAPVKPQPVVATIRRLFKKQPEAKLSTLLYVLANKVRSIFPATRKDEGFKGAQGRMQHIIDNHFNNDFSLVMQDNPQGDQYVYPVDVLTTIENIQLGSDTYDVSFTPRRGKDKNTLQKSNQQAFFDIGYVATATPSVDPQGEKYVGLATSTGVVFANQDHGEKFFTASGETGFTVPAGHHYVKSFEGKDIGGQKLDPQNPHILATGGKYSRAMLLEPAIVTSMVGSPYLDARRTARQLDYVDNSPTIQAAKAIGELRAALERNKHTEENSEEQE
jgi:hypothetical protein